MTKVRCLAVSVNPVLNLRNKMHDQRIPANDYSQKAGTSEDGGKWIGGKRKGKEKTGG